MGCMFTVKYSRYFGKYSTACRSVEEIEAMIDSDECYVTSVFLSSGEEVTVDPDPFIGGPHGLLEKLRERLLELA